MHTIEDKIHSYRCQFMYVIIFVKQFALEMDRKKLKK